MTKTLVWVEHEGGVVKDATDADAGDGDIVSFDGYTADSALTIDLGLQKAIVTNDDQTTTTERREAHDSARRKNRTFFKNCKLFRKLREINHQPARR